MLVASGCAFIGAGAIGDITYVSPEQKPGKYDSFGRNMLKSDYSMQINSPRTFTMADVKAEWGKPEEVYTSGDETELVYAKGLRWRGFIVSPLIPIPLAIPVGRKTVRFKFNNDELVRWTIHGTHYCYSFIALQFLTLVVPPIFPAVDCENHTDMFVCYGKSSCNIPFYDACYPAQRTEGCAK